MNSKSLAEREKTLINDMKVKALRDDLTRKIKEQERIAELLVAQEAVKDPTSVQGQLDRARRTKKKAGREGNGGVELSSRSPAPSNRPP